MKYATIALIFVILISCSKEMTNNYIQTDPIELKKGMMVNQDSVDKVNSGVLVKSKINSYELDSIQKIKSNASGISTLSSVPVKVLEYTDWSGLIHIVVYQAYSAFEQHPHLEVPVPSGYVLVGGGARVENEDPFNRYLAFLTESRPDPELTKWIGSSKDHIYTDPHWLDVYAIGMRIDGVTEEYLRSRMKVFTHISAVANHPTDSVQIPSNYLLLGGGAFDDYHGYGNMLVSSYPAGRLDKWIVSGKDHRRPDPSAITAYAIGIENISFPSIGYIKTGYSYHMSPRLAGFNVCDQPTPDGLALTCCGGRVTYEGSGRMIVQLFPIYPHSTRLTSWQHTYLDFGINYSYVISIEKSR